MSKGSYDQYHSDKAWRESAMQRQNGVDRLESEKRRIQADSHNQQHDISDPEVLHDQQLYILGKMDMEEYQAYLLFKHSSPG
ncbi:hypothetical protein F3F96_06925 [Mariprofundus sp. NF]|uniref:hypothetical protein n=1 Tax=Mariprofundus sp. NF TaxID=2608716 RepID=UPI00159F9CA5|nr:hypothetical protein [Mariprofundus sp. NF]NWF38866.1 hypothetical protein [Mariprofundus sp. NF]